MKRMSDAWATNIGMSTLMTHRAFGKYAEAALRTVCEESTRLENLLSRFIPRSEVSSINRSAGVKCERLSAETYEVLANAIEFSKLCHGLFDVTIAPLVNLWSNSKATLTPPAESRIKQLIPLVDYRDLLLDAGEKTAQLRRIGQSIDLGGVGKGYAGDRFLEVFKKFEVASAFTNIGGNVVALGAKPDGSPWNVGIQHPRQENSLIGIVSVIDKAIVTSGDYQRYFIDNKGKRQHHILDPSSGCPADSGLMSVTVVADSSTAADALSTILFIAGKEKALDLLKYFPGTEAILIDLDLQAYVTQGLIDCFLASEGINIEVLN